MQNNLGNLVNYQNYGPYRDLIKEGSMVLDPTVLNKDNYDFYFFGLVNILRDGIETEYVQKTFIDIHFDRIDIKLSIPDYFFNILFWKLLVDIDQQIKPKHIIFDTDMTKDMIKDYIDKFFISINKTTLDIVKMNNIICDTIYAFKYIDEFSMYFANTINLEDTQILMNKNKEFYDILHADLSNVLLEDVKNVGIQLTNRMIEIIKEDGEHCLSDSFKAHEGINPRQYKEFSVNIGTKPNGKGSIYPYTINSNYLTGGLTDLISYFIESSSGRTAQILSKENVGSSGYFARLLGLNNHDTILHRDPNYICDSKNFEEVEIKNMSIFKNVSALGRYYRLSPNGMEYKMTENDTHLLGKIVYLRSPITCASHSRDEGICYRCYSDLAYINSNINVGKLAAEILSEQLTQKLLSAKHLLETVIKKMEWTKAFDDYFILDGNIIMIDSEANINKFKLVINKKEIESEDVYDNFEYNDYIKSFEIINPKGERIQIQTTNWENMYLSLDLLEILKSKKVNEDDEIIINMTSLVDIPLFLMVIHNNELTKSLEKLQHIINNNELTKSHNRHQILQAFLEATIEGGININSIHCELIISNQIRDNIDILETPIWTNINPPYQLLTLKQSLTNNPRVVTSLSYENISKILYNPLTFRKTKPSFVDLFFMKQPQLYLRKEILSTRRPKKESINPMIFGKEQKKNE